MNNQRFPDKLKAELNRLKEQHLYRELSLDETGIDFYSNDYLGLGHTTSSFSDVTIGAGGSRLISGNYASILNLEKHISEFHHAQDALVFPSGFQANIGLYKAIARKDDTLFFDEHVHASIRDGMLLSFAKKTMFKHNDLIDLELKLKSAEGEKYIVVESLYSMDGDLAPLEELAHLCVKYSAFLIVDEAHANGIYGNNGQGLAVSDEVLNVCLARIYGYGKAFGCQGASIVGSFELKNLLINRHRAFIFSTGVSPLFTEAISNAYIKVRAANSEREKLFQNIQYYNSLFSEREQSQWMSPIKSVPCPGNESVMKLASELRSNGFMVKGIRSPTVAPGTERIRIILHAFNTFDELNALRDALNISNNK